MTTTITGITVEMLLENKAFIRELGKTVANFNANTNAMRRSLSTLQGSFQEATNFAKGFLGAALSAATVRQILSFTSAQINAAAAIKEQSQAVGIAASDLQAYRIIGEHTGVAVEQLDRSIGIFVRTLGQAKAGLGPLVSGLKDTDRGLLDQLRSSDSATEAMDMMLQAIREAPTVFERARLAQLAFGRSGLDMVLLVDEATKAARQHLIDIGLVLRDDVIERADQLQDSMRDLQRSFDTGFTTGFIDGFNDSLTATEDRLREATQLGTQFGEAVGKSLSDVMAILDKIEAFNNGGSLSDLVSGFFSLGNLTIAEGSVLAWIRDTLGPLWDRFSKLMGFVPQQAINTGPTFPKGDTSFPTPSPGIEPIFNPDAAKAAQEHADALKLASDRARETADAHKAAAEAARLHADAERDYADFIGKAGTPMQQYEFAIKQITAAQLDGAQKAALIQQQQFELIGTYLDGIGQATGALASAFKENKAIQIANAIVNTAAGVVKALGDPKLPFPLDFAVAASIAAAGAAQIATILSTEPGSGSRAMRAPKGGTGGKVSGASTASKSQAPSGPAQVVTINIEGDVFGPEHFRKIVDGINGVQRDGTALLRVA